jgi:hypothetical protein
MTSESCVAAANVMLVEQEQESSQSDVVVNNSEECDCVELRNIKYKSMLLKKTSPKQVTKHNSNIDDFLEKERTQNKEDQWVKLDKTMKMKKVSAFVETYASENVLCVKDKNALSEFLTCSLDQKKLFKTKEVIYDKVTGTIKSIPCLVYCPTSVKKFTLKRCEKRQSTLKSLAPKTKLKVKSLVVAPSLSLVETTVTTSNLKIT